MGEMQVSRILGHLSPYSKENKNAATTEGKKEGLGVKQATAVLVISTELIKLSSCPNKF